MPKREHRPRRSCLGCGARDDQSAMLRVVAWNNGELRLQRSGNGRGGYLHNDQECWRAFLRRKSLYRAYRKEIGKEAKEKLIRELSEGHWE